MLDRKIHRALRRGLFAGFTGCALLMCAGSGWAVASGAEPLPATERATFRTPEARAVPSLAHRKTPATLDYPRGPHDRATSTFGSPVVTEHPKAVQTIRITPASANWKVNGLNPKLMALLARVQSHFGEALHIISGCRSKAHNRRVRGAKRSQHLHCKAADFQIPGVSKHRLAAFLKNMPGRGGVGVYCRSSYVHLDVGPVREWHKRCGRRKKQVESPPPGSYSSSNK